MIRGAIILLGLACVFWFHPVQAHEPGPAELVVAHESGYPPFASIDPGGKPVGYLIDLWKLYGEVNHVKISFILDKFDQSVQMVRDGRAQVHAGLFWNQDREQYLAFGNPLVTVRTSLFSTRPLDLETAFSELIIGVVQGSHEDYYVHHNYPGARLIYFPNSMELIRALAFNMVDGALTEDPVGLHLLNFMGVRGDAVHVHPLYRLPMRLAVAAGNTALLDELDAGWHLVPREDLGRVARRWFVQAPTSSYWPTVMAVVAGALALVILVRVFFLARR